MSDRRMPLLADRLLHRMAHMPGISHANSRRFLADKIRNARRFVFDEAAAVRTAEVVRDIPETLLRNSEFACQPYDLMWVEFYHPPFNLALNGRESDDDADHTIGYLFDHGSVYSFVGGTLANPTAGPGVLPFIYCVNQPFDIEKLRKFCNYAQCPPQMVDHFMWGETINRLPLEQRIMLRSQHSFVEVFPPNTATDEAARMFRNFVNGSAGDMRNMLAILLMLNRPSLTQVVREEGRGRGWIKNKVGPFLSYTTITIPLDPKPTLIKIGTPEGDGVPRRRHEVRGHFCHNEEARKGNCEHEWRPVQAHEVTSRMDADDAPEDRRWFCPNCKGKRWWKRNHARGDAGRGFVMQEGYNVTYDSNNE